MIALLNGKWSTPVKCCACITCFAFTQLAGYTTTNASGNFFVDFTLLRV